MITGKDPISLQVLEAFTQKQKLADIAATFDLSLDQVKRLKRLFNYIHTVDSLTNEQKEKLKANETTLENNQALIAEYKEKNDTLSGLVAKYQAFAEENEQLKAAFAEEKEALLTSAASEKQKLEEALAITSSEAKANEAKADELEKVLADEKAQSEQATALLQERHELALERAIVKAEREYQEKLQAQLDTYNTRITELQAENDRIRASYENRLEDLLKKNTDTNIK